MSFAEIRRMPTCVANNHESVLRAFNILAKVKELLREGSASPAVLLEIIEDLEGGDRVSAN